MPGGIIRESLEEEPVYLKQYSERLMRKLEKKMLDLEREITGHKQVEEALKESEENYRSLVEQSLQGLVVIQDFRIVFANTAFAEISGYAVEELLSLSPKEMQALIHSEDQALVWGRFRDRLAGKAVPPRYEYRGIRKDGTVCWLEMFASRIEHGGKPAIQGAIVDITERKRTEAALKEYSERLEEMVEERTKELRDAQEQLARREKLAILGQLAGGVAHDLRNPLGAISNAAYYLKLVLPDASETVKEHLKMIAEQVRNSDRIITDLLDFSRTRILDRQEVAVSELVAQVLEKRPPPEGVEVAADIAPNLLPVYVDRHQMGQALDNLVTNAYQAMTEGGDLTISAQAEEGAVALSIADTGVGISEENLPKLFEPLFTTRAKGLGLGLMVVKTLVEANEGSIEIQSVVGKGSTFTVRLPTPRGRQG